jgi:5-methylcytosine-specific restriction endonuclease McrA
MQNATADNHWYAFYLSRVQNYHARFGKDFCLIINGSKSQNDAYVIPYEECEGFYTEDYDDKGRWVGTIRNNQIKLTCPGMPAKVFSGSLFYNAFKLLDTVENTSPIEIPGDQQLILTAENNPDLTALKALIEKFNALYASVSPIKKVVVSEKVSRPNAISDFVKQLHNYKCQLCGSLGFTQQNGSLYAEAHHILELHELIPGSYCSDNLIVVCANCHRKLHYANVKFESQSLKQVIAIISGQPFPFTRNIVSQ